MFLLNSTKRNTKISETFYKKENNGKFPSKKYNKISVNFDLEILCGILPHFPPPDETSILLPWPFLLRMVFHLHHVLVIAWPFRRVLPVVARTS